ncbi:MAG: hypothetical protein KME13_05635 [Myxacorys californica WJT36-NPBG1]|jgi:hypothetical protein|nr:hypothetical protein [Myxacorys californica WJT36-NPBG1]
MPQTKLGTFHDASGKITVAVFERKAGNQQAHFHDFACTVPDDMVVIGGGAEATNSPPNGALLTASYPNQNLSAWLASSKDHERPQPHFLKVYAIGLKVAGMPRDALRDHIHIGRSVSELAQHPEVSESVPPGYLLISGGFHVNWLDFNSHGGNLATASFPENAFSWKARSKDHMTISPAILSVYAIGIRENLPVGRVQHSIQTKDSGHAAHPSTTADVLPGFALVGGGAEIHWSGEGNLLWQLRPTTDLANQDFTAGGKDHMKPSPATLTAYSIGIKIV